MRKPAVLATSIATVAGLILSVIAVTSASALTPGIAFSSANLSTWQTNGEVYGLASVHGKVVVGGSFTQISPPAGTAGTAQSRPALAILNAETGAPDSCQLPVSFSAGTPVIRTVIASPDANTIYVGGSFTSIGGVAVSRVAAIDPVSCKVLALRVPTIGATVIGMYATTTSLYIGGDFVTVGGQSRQHFAAINLSNNALLPWAPAIDTIPGQSVAVGRAISVSPDGSKVAIGGDFFTVNGQDSHSIAVVDSATGANIQNYARGFIPDTSVTKTIWSDGSKFYVGNEGTGGGVFDGRLAVDWATLTQVWRDNCLGATQALVTFQGTLYIASHAHNCSSNNAFGDGARNFFMAEGTSTPTILQWFPTANDGINEGIGPRALTVATGSNSGKNYLWYGGEFTQVNGKAQQGLTRFGPDDATTPPVPVVAAEALTSNSVQVRFRTVVDPDDGILTYNVYRNNSVTPIWTGTANSTWWKRPQVTYVDNSVVAGTTYSYRVSVSDGVNTSALSSSVSAKAVAKATDYPTQVIADGASLYWRMDEAASPWAQDKSGQTTAGVNGIYSKGLNDPSFGFQFGAAGALAGSTDTATTFDGTQGYIYDDQNLPAPTTYSIETWIKTGTTSGGKIVGYGNGVPETNSNATNLSGNYDRQIYMDNAGNLTFGVYTGGVQSIRTANAYNDNAWHYIVGTQGPAGMKLYVDGVKVGQNSTTGNQSYNGNWHVGGDQLNGWPNQPASNYFAGTIDDTAIYGAPLSAQQVANHFTLAGGQITVPVAPTDAYGAKVFNDTPEIYWRLNDSGSTAKDSSFNAQGDGVIGADAQTLQTGAVPFGTSVTLNGTQTSAIATKVSEGTTTAFSTEAWFKTTSTTGGKIVGFEDAQTGNGSNYDKQTYMTNTGRVVFGVYANGVQTIESTSSYNDGAWHHVVGTQGAGGMSLYIDGAVVGTNPTTNNQVFTGFWRAGGGNLGGWTDSPSTFEFKGSLDEVAIYDQELSSAAVAAHYSLGSGSPADTIAPSAPTGVSATVTGNSVALSWSASTDNVGVTGYSVYRGLTASFAPDASTKLADVSTTSFTDPNVPVGTYYYEVVARDAASNVSLTSSSAAATIAPAPDTTPPSVPSGVTASVSGNAVSLAWTSSTDNVGVTGYSVYRGTSTDFVPGPASVISTVTSPSYVDSSVPAGTYYYKIQATDAAANASAPSTVVSVTIAPPPDTTAPTAPTAVSATATGSTIAVTWAASTDNVGVAGYSVYRGVTSNFVPSASNKVADVTSTKFDNTTVPPGTYFYQVVASDAAGNVSPATASAAVTVVAQDTTAPTVPAPVSAVVSGTSATVSWGASTDNVGVAGYSLYRGTAPAFVPDASALITTTTSTTFTDANLAVGTYYYKVTASDAAGNVSAPSNTVTATITPPGAVTTTVKIAPTEDAYVARSAPTTNYGSDLQLSSRGAGTNVPTTSFLKFALPQAPAGTTLTSATITVRTSTDPTAGSTDVHTFTVVTGAWSESTVTWNTQPTGPGAVLGTLSGATAINTSYSSVWDISQLTPLAGTTVAVSLTDPGVDNIRLFSNNASATLRPYLTLVYTQN